MVPMNPWTLLYLWVGSHALQLAFAVCACLQKPDAAGRKQLGSMVVSAIASILPLWTLFLVLHVFVIGGSSNVAQLAGGTYDLFGLWVKWWPNLFFGNMLAFPVILGAACFQPYPQRHWASFASRVCALAASFFAFNAVGMLAPDA
jgi:hypothetical protein